MSAPAATAQVQQRSSLPPVVQRTCGCGGVAGPDGECAACKAKRLQRKAAGATGTAPGSAPTSVSRVLRRGGEPLARAVRAQFEPAFRRDFGSIRIHADDEAGRSARDVGALAYTVGQQIVFGRGQYQPGSSSGRKLIAHELTHTIQQRSERESQAGLLQIESPSTSHEAEARQIEERFQAGNAETVRERSHGVSIQRQDAPDTNDDLAADPETGPGTIVIWFKLDSTDFLKDSETDSQIHFNDALAEVKKRLADTGGTAKVELVGYASEEGEGEHNQQLSERRADRVKELMVLGGVPESQIVATGKGVASDLPGRKWNRRVEVKLEKVTKFTFPPDTIEGKRPKAVCGPDVTKQIADAVAFTQSAFAGWSKSDRERSCNTLDDFNSGEVAWDIANLHHQDWIKDDYGPACATLHQRPKCHASIQVGDQCFYAGTPNYVIFGTMCKLCFNHFVSQSDRDGAYRFSKSSMKALIDLHKGIRVPGIRTPAPNYTQSRDWSIAGYDGWPAGGTPPKGDRSNCSPVCPTPYSGPDFQVNWCPILWPSGMKCGR